MSAESTPTSRGGVNRARRAILAVVVYQSVAILTSAVASATAGHFGLRNIVPGLFAALLFFLQKRAEFVPKKASVAALLAALVVDITVPEFDATVRLGLLFGIPQYAFLLMGILLSRLDDDPPRPTTP